MGSQDSGGVSHLRRRREGFEMMEEESKSQLHREQIVGLVAHSDCKRFHWRRESVRGSSPLPVSGTPGQTLQFGSIQKFEEGYLKRDQMLLVSLAVQQLPWWCEGKGEKVELHLLLLHENWRVKF
jgi:hypothetical protein